MRTAGIALHRAAALLWLWATGAGAGEPFVTVDLTDLYHGRFIGAEMGDGYGIAEGQLPAAGSRVEIEGIPFHIGTRENGDHLDVGLARWPDVEEDPVGFYSHYKPDGYGDPEVPVVRIPRQNYSGLYLLCLADTDPAKTPVVSFRLGLHDGHGILYDTAVQVPRWNEAGNEHVVAHRPLRLSGPAGEAEGRLFVVKARLRSGDIQDIAEPGDHLDLELTKELHVAVRNPDPARFRVRPLGRPSAVRVLALTLTVAPVQMRVSSAEVGNVFVAQPPVFSAALRNVTDRERRARVEAVATDYYGDETRTRGSLVLAPLAADTLRLELPRERLGWFEVVFRLLDGEEVSVERRTTFSLLPEDRRRATFRDSPFGTWCFGMGHRGTTVDQAGPLMYKAGIRRTFGYGYEALREHGLTKGQHSSIVGTHKVGETDAEALRRTFEEWPETRQALVFHESNIGPLKTRPGFLTGDGPAPLDSAETAELERRWEHAVAASEAVRRIDPEMELVFGNMVQPSIEQFLARGYPREYIDRLGEESPGFMRMPERQPEVAGFGSLWWMKEMARHYGYGDAGLTVSFEWMYHSTNPGNLHPRTAAAYNVRDCLLALAYGVPNVNPALAYDVGNAYYFSNWGASGLAHRPPELNPKPGYVAYATLTAQLDRARFSRKLDTGSTSLFALEFTRPEGDPVYVLWTIRGEREVRLSVSGAGPAVVTDGMGKTPAAAPSDAEVTVDDDDPARDVSGAAAALVTDGMGNSSPAAVAGGEVLVVVDDSPRYVSGVEVSAVRAGASRYTSAPGPEAVLLHGLDDPGSWRVNARRDTAFESYTWDAVRRPGRLTWSSVRDPERGAVTRVALEGPQGGSDVTAWYNYCELDRPVPLPGEPRQIGLWVYGNSSWSRIVFVLEDAEGEEWTHLGAALHGRADWNTNDTESTSFVNFDGWRYMGIDLPGEYPVERYQWPRKCNWRSTGGDGLVDHPLRLKGFYVQLREKLVYVDEMVPAASRHLLLDDLMCSY